MVVSVTLIVSSVLIAYYPPAQYNYTDESFNFELKPEYNETQFNIVFDHHSHTKYSDGILTVEHNILWHIAHGFNAMALSDHNTLDNADELAIMVNKYKDQIVIIQGFEWTTNRIHLNFIGISEDIPVPSNKSTDVEIQEAIDAAHDQGGIVIVNHIPWSLPIMPDHPTRAQLLAWEVDYIEIVNENIYDEESVPWCNNTGGFGMITGTDMHYPMNVYSWTLMNTTSFTATAVMEQLSARNTTILYDRASQVDQTTGPPSVKYKLVKPLISIGRNFKPTDIAVGLIDWQAFGIAIAYIIVGFVVVESVTIGIAAIRKRKKKEDYDKYYD